MFPIVAVPIYMLTNSAWALSFLHILTNTCNLLSFWWYPLFQVWGGASLWFRFAFPWRLVMLSIFSYAYWPSSLEKYLLRSSVCFLIRVLDFSWCWVAWVLQICWTLIPYCKYFLPVRRLFYCFVDSFLHCGKAFYFALITFDYFCFCFTCVRRQIHKYIAKKDVTDNTAYVFLLVILLFQVLNASFLSILSSILYMCEKAVLFDSFAWSCQFSNTIIEETVFFPLYILDFIVED